MNVKRAKTAGFCFGVKRAVETVYEQAKNSDAAPIYTYGPLPLYWIRQEPYVLSPKRHLITINFKI